MQDALNIAERLGGDVFTIVDPQLSPEDKLSINQALSHLPRQQLEILSGRLTKVSERQLAIELGISRITVRRQYHQAIQTLQGLLS